MNKIIFADNTELEVTDVSKADSLYITIDTADVDAVIAKFRDKAATAVMRYYMGIDLIRGYSGFTKMQEVKFTPDVTVGIDYSATDQATESGFHEDKTDKCIVTMQRQSLMASVAQQTAQNTANIDYLAMETGVSL